MLVCLSPPMVYELLDLSPLLTAAVCYQGFQQVLASIDSSINHIHDEAVEQGGAYTATQKATLQ